MITINSVFNIILLVSEKAKLASQASQTNAAWFQAYAAWIQAGVALITGIYVIFEIHNHIVEHKNNRDIDFTYKFIKNKRKNGNIDKIIFDNKSGIYALGYVYLFKPRYIN